MIQNYLGNALATPATREPDTAWLEEEETAAAHRLALDERTRERVPLSWAGRAGSLSAALTVVAERTGDAATPRRSVRGLWVCAARALVP